MPLQSSQYLYWLRGVLDRKDTHPLYPPWAANRTPPAGKRFVQPLLVDSLFSPRAHANGFNTAFTDFHAKWVADRPPYKISRAGDGGDGGAGQPGSPAYDVTANTSLWEDWEVLSRSP